VTLKILLGGLNQGLTAAENWSAAAIAA
jgi:hypothetical protein